MEREKLRPNRSLLFECRTWSVSIHTGNWTYPQRDVHASLHDPHCTHKNYNLIGQQLLLPGTPLNHNGDYFYAVYNFRSTKTLGLKTMHLNSLQRVTIYLNIRVCIYTFIHADKFHHSHSHSHESYYQKFLTWVLGACAIISSPNMYKSCLGTRELSMGFEVLRLIIYSCQLVEFVMFSLTC